MNTLPEDIQDTIHKYKHQMTFNDVTQELHDIFYIWHAEQFACRHCKWRPELMYRFCPDEFKHLNDYENRLHVDLRGKHILDIIKEIANTK